MRLGANCHIGFGEGRPPLSGGQGQWRAVDISGVGGRAAVH